MINIYCHPFSAYTWKALINAYEHDLPFAFRLLEPSEPDNIAFVAARQPGGQMPVLEHDDRVVFESNPVIEYIDRLGSGPRLIPADPLAAIEARQLAEAFDDYVMDVMQRIVYDAIRPEDQRHPPTVAEARTALDRAYGWFDTHMIEREWATGAAFTLADIAAAPALFYADWAHPIAPEHAALRAYRARLLARPSIARAVDEARPYRAYFPLGAPDRD